MTSFLLDIRQAVRFLRNTPAFTATAILSLALGIGASTAVFSIADTVFFRPLPYPHSDRLAWVAIQFPSIKAEFLPSPDYVMWRRNNQVFEQLAAVSPGAFPMILRDTESVEVSARRVSSNFLAALDVTPALGRSFSAHEELPNGPKSVLLTNSLWRTRFRARSDVIGTSIMLNGQPYAVIGVLPPSFTLPMDVKFDLLTTVPISPSATHRDRVIMLWWAIGRLAPHVSLGQAQADMERLFEASKRDDPPMFRSDTRPVVQSLQQHRIGDARLLLLILTAAVGSLLLIACANVANLLLARWSARSRELAIRAAVGAGRTRLIRQLFTEAALLSVLGCALAMILVFIAFRAFVHFAGSEIPRLNELTISARVFGIALAVSIVTTLLFGVLPALRAGYVDVSAALQAGRFGIARGFSFLRRTLVASEIALSVILLSGAALLLETLWHLEKDRLGFQPEHLFTLTVPLRGSKFEQRNHEALADDLLTYIRHLPGTEAAALGQCSPPSGAYMTLTFSRSDRPLPEPFHRGDNILVCGAGRDYFRVLGTPVLRGRSFVDADFQHPGTLAIINQTAAETYFPGENPLGKQIGGNRALGWKTVVGIVADAKNQGLNRQAAPEMFVNDLEFQSAAPLWFFVRSIGDENAIYGDIRSTVRSLDPTLLAKFETLDHVLDQQTAGVRFNGILLTSFAVLALLMAIIGVYGVLAFAVAGRTQEIGIRMALGAESHRVLALVMREGAVLVMVGVIGGLCGALALTRYLQTLLYGVTPTDPATYVVVILALGMVASIATLLPARRAAQTDPISALRHE